MRIDLAVQDLDLLDEGDQDRDRGAGRGRIRCGDHLRPAQMLSAQDGLDSGGLGVDIAAASTRERRPDLVEREPGRTGRIRRLAQQLQGVGRIQVGECLQRGGEVLPQRMPQPLGVAGAFPDQRLVRPGHHLDRLSLRAVPGHRPQLVGVGAHHVGQRVRVRGIAFRTGNTQPLPIPCHLQRIDREHRVPGGHQRRHPRPPIGFDPDRHLRRVSVLTELCADHRVQPSYPGRTLGQPGLGQRAPGRIHHLDIVVILRPVISHQQQRFSRPRSAAFGSARENHQRPNEAVLTPPTRGHDIPSAIHPPNRPAEARSGNRTQRPGTTSAHPPAATGSESAGQPTRYHSLGATWITNRIDRDPSDTPCRRVQSPLDRVRDVGHRVADRADHPPRVDHQDHPLEPFGVGSAEGR
jgi:hypothetical protein